MPHQRVQSIRSSTKNTRPAAGTREPGELYTNFPDLQLGVINASKVATDLIAVRFFSATTNYSTGDFVIHGGVGYRAKNAIVSGAFNAADWDTIHVTGSAEPPIAAGTTSQYWRGDKSWQTLDKSAVGLGAVDNTSDANKPISTAEQTALNLKANIAGPTFTGDPRAPTPAVGDNDTSIATTAFVATSFAPLLNPTLGGDPRSVTPATSDNDTSIATTAYVQANLASYAPLDSPVFIGNPRGPTPMVGDNDTSIATTEFVQTGLGGKANAAHTHAQSDITNLAIDLALKAPLDSPTFSGDARAVTPATADNDTSVATTAFVRAAMATYSTGTTAGTRNRIVNGAMQVSQENGGVAGTANGYYGADQWLIISSHSGVTTVQRKAWTTPNGSVHRFSVVITTADASLAAGDVLTISQNIEGVRIPDFLYGTGSAKQAVVRFGFRGPAGTYAVALVNSANNRSYLATFTIAAGQANTDTTQTLIVPGDTTGTWLTDTGIGIRFWVTLAAGTTYHGVAGWQAGNLISTSAVSNGMATAGAEFHLYDVGLYLDPQATGLPPAWTMPDEAEELRACQRYYYKSLWHHTIGTPGAGLVGATTLTFQTTMRVAAALADTGGGTVVNVATVGVDSGSVTGCRVYATATAAGSVAVSNRTMTASARM